MKTKKEIINFINSFTKKISRIELNKIINGMGMTYSSDEELYMWLHAVSYTHLTLPTNREV